jgi:hypothetical protein
MKKKKPIGKQRFIYAGPPLPQLGLVDRKVFHDGENMKAIDYIHERWSKEIAQCKAFAELFIPLPEWPAVRRALNFDVARNVRGNSRHAIFYREVEAWRAKQGKTKPSVGVELPHA